MKLIKTKAKEIFTKTKLPGCDFVINPYVGCEHACSYCYAKFICKWRPSNYGEWGSWVEAKINAPELVKNKYVKNWVYMSSICDPYQPAEKELKLTRKILENLDKRTKLTIQTKSDLVLRDIDLLKNFKTIEIGFTINSFEGKTKNIFEPHSSTNKERIKALKILKKNKFKTFVFLSPLIPSLIDLKKVINETKEFADYYFFEFINIRAAGKKFIEKVKKEFPKSYEVLINKKKLSEFVKESKKIISSEKIRVEAIIIH